MENAGWSLADLNYGRGNPLQLAALVEHALLDHLIRPSSDGGTVRPRAFAVLRLITNSNFVGCSKGRSAGLAPLNILSTWLVVRRYQQRSAHNVRVAAPIIQQP